MHILNRHLYRGPFPSNIRKDEIAIEIPLNVLLDTIHKHESIRNSKHFQQASKDALLKRARSPSHEETEWQLKRLASVQQGIEDRVHKRARKG